MCVRLLECTLTKRAKNLNFRGRTILMMAWDKVIMLTGCSVNMRKRLFRPDFIQHWWFYLPLQHMRVIISYVMGKFDIAPFNYPVEYKNKFKKREMITWRLSKFSKNIIILKFSKRCNLHCIISMLKPALHQFNFVNSV